MINQIIEAQSKQLLIFLTVFCSLSLCAGGLIVNAIRPQTKHITFTMGDSSDLSFMQLDEAKGTVTIYEKDGDVNQVFTCRGGFEK